MSQLTEQDFEQPVRDQVNGEIRIADAIQPHLELVTASAMWSDEQWAEHDANVAARREIWNENETAERVRAKRLQLEDRFDRVLGFPARALDVAMVADETNSLIARIKRWDLREHTILVLSGSKGRGKTCAAAWWALHREHSTDFVRASTFAASSRYDRDSRKRVLSASALVLDDLGREWNDAKGSFLVDLDELIDVFYGNRRPLLITTNLPKETVAGTKGTKIASFHERYGEVIYDRLRECGAWYATEGESLRTPGERT